MNILPVGTKMYAIYTQYMENEKIDNVKVLICKIKTYMRKGGDIIPVLVSVEDKKHEISTAQYTVFKTMEAAVKALKPTKK